MTTAEYFAYYQSKGLDGNSALTTSSFNLPCLGLKVVNYMLKLFQIVVWNELSNIQANICRDVFKYVE